MTASRIAYPEPTMDAPARETLPYRGGHAALTDTHLVVVRGRYRAESLALRHLAGVSVERAHSFRHRVWGLLVGLALLIPAALSLAPDDLVGNLAIFGFFRGKMGFAILFAGFFGLVFLWGVFTSRPIWWLRVRYGRTTKLIPVPGAEQDQVERFAEAVTRAAGGVPCATTGPSGPSRALIDTGRIDTNCACEREMGSGRRPP